MHINTDKKSIESQVLKPLFKPTPKTRTSRGGLDEINPDDIVYGDFAGDLGEKFGDYIDLIYLDSRSNYS